MQRDPQTLQGPVFEETPAHTKLGGCLKGPGRAAPDTYPTSNSQEEGPLDHIRQGPRRTEGEQASGLVRPGFVLVQKRPALASSQPFTLDVTFWPSALTPVPRLDDGLTACPVTDASLQPPARHPLSGRGPARVGQSGSQLRWET